MSDSVKRIVVLISGRGSNFKALLDQPPTNGRVVGVISSRGDARGLEYAKVSNLPASVVERGGFARREDFEFALQQEVDKLNPDFIALAGFMCVLSGRFVAKYQGRLINIHPSLLPDFPGLNTHARALQEKVTEHGCTVHFVTEKVDAGPIIAQARVRVRPEDDEKSLASRVLEQEHRLYPQALGWLCQGCVCYPRTL